MAREPRRCGLIRLGMAAMLLMAPVCGIQLVNTQAYIDCAASTTCTALCAASARAARTERRAAGR